jgi:quercetin dioxygenase-like cupin family protein
VRAVTPFKTFLTTILLFLFGGIATGDENPSYPSYKKLLTPLLESGQTIIGQPIAYPSGTPKVTGAMVFLAPGKETGWHIHSVPLFAYVLQGELTVDYGDKGVKVYKPGDAFLEAMNWPHNGVNKGTVPVLILAVYMGAEGKPTATPVPAPPSKPQ